MWTEKDNLLPHHDENKLIQEGQIYLSIVMNGGVSMFNLFKKKEAEVSEKVKGRIEKQEERRQKAQARGHKPIK